MPTFVEIPAQPPGSAARAKRLAHLGYTAIALGAGAYWFNSPWQNTEINLLAISICFMGFWPMLRWLQRNDPAYPLLEVLQLIMVPFYAVPLLTEHKDVVNYPESILIKASELVLLFQIACSVGGALADRRHLHASRVVWWKDEFVSDDNLKFTSYTLVLTTLWLGVYSMTQWVPQDLAGTLRAIFFGIGIISGFIQARMWGAGQLNQSQKIVFSVNIFLQLMLSSLSLLLVTGLITLLLVLVGYFSSARRVPWLVCAVVLPVFAILHNGKHKMREIYWSGQHLERTIAGIPAFYREWFEYGLATDIKITGHDETSSNSSLLDRASLLQIVCFTISAVPEHSGYLGGATYSYIPAQIIPRFLWPNKPSPNDSVKILSVRLGMLSEEQAETTSIAYGLIAEAYANFGFYGDMFLALLLGWSLRLVARSTAACKTLSAGGIFRILCMAWCLNAETTLAVWLSSLYQACVAIFLPLYFYKSVFGN